MEWRNFIRSPRVTGDKVRQEIVNGPKDMGENSSDSGGVEQTDEDKARNKIGKTVRSRENRGSKDGEGTIDRIRSIVDSQAKKKLRMDHGTCVCGFAAEERKRLKIVKEVSNGDVHIVGMQESWEKNGGDRMQSWRVRMDREKEKGAG